MTYFLILMGFIALGLTLSHIELTQNKRARHKRLNQRTRKSKGPISNDNRR